MAKKSNTTPGTKRPTKTYDEMADCNICGHPIILTQYQADKGTILRTCDRCGNQWEELPLNAKGNSNG